jgi:hypothetical protein
VSHASRRHDVESDRERVEHAKEVADRLSPILDRDIAGRGRHLRRRLAKLNVVERRLGQSPAGISLRIGLSVYVEVPFATTGE